MHPFSDPDLLTRQGEQQAAARSDGAEGDEARVEPLQAHYQSGGRGKIRGAQAVVRQEPRGKIINVDLILSFLIMKMKLTRFFLT